MPPAASRGVVFISAECLAYPRSNAVYIPLLKPQRLGVFFVQCADIVAIGQISAKLLAYQNKSLPDVVLLNVGKLIVQFFLLTSAVRPDAADSLPASAIGMPG